MFNFQLFCVFSDVNKISEAIADKFSVFIQRVTTFVGGFIVGFLNSWELTLVIMAISPLLGVGAALMGRVSPIALKPKFAQIFRMEKEKLGLT